MLNRDDAWTLLCEYTQNENLLKHASSRLSIRVCSKAGR